MCGHVQYYPVTSLYQVKTCGGPVGLYPLNNNTVYVINYPQLGYSFYVVLVCTQTSPPVCNTQRYVTFVYETSRRQYNLPSVIHRFRFTLLGCSKTRREDTNTVGKLYEN